MLQLAGEIRNSIYEYYFPHSIVTCARYNPDTSPNSIQRLLPLLQVSQQLRKEAWSLLFETRTLDLPLPQLPAFPFDHEMRQHLRSLILHDLKEHSHLLTPWPTNGIHFVPSLHNIMPRLKRLEIHIECKQKRQHLCHHVDLPPYSACWLESTRNLETIKVVGCGQDGCRPCTRAKNRTTGETVHAEDLELRLMKNVLREDDLVHEKEIED